MPALFASPYLAFVLAAYGIVLVALAALSFYYVRDYRRQKNRRDQLEQQSRQ